MEAVTPEDAPRSARLTHALATLRAAITDLRDIADAGTTEAETVELATSLVDAHRSLGLVLAGTAAQMADDYITRTKQSSPKKKSGKSFFRDATEFVAMVCSLTKAEASRLIKRGQHLVTHVLSPTFAKIADQLDPVVLDEAIKTRDKIDKTLRDAGVAEPEKHLEAVEKHLANRAQQVTPAEFLKIAKRKASSVEADFLGPHRELTPAQRDAIEGFRYTGPVGTSHHKYEIVVDQEGHEQLQSLESEIRGPKNKEHRFDDRSTAMKVLDAILAAIRFESLTEQRRTYRRKPLYTVLVNAETLIPKLAEDRNPTNPSLLPRHLCEGTFTGEWDLRDLRRAACEAEILPIVFNGPSQPLDVGRKQRTFTEPMYRALAARDRGCVVPGCTFPPDWCEAHHIVPWIDGGETSVENGALLCKHHHDALHAGQFSMQTSNGAVYCVLPEEIDPSGTPRRNLYFRD